MKKVIIYEEDHLSKYKIKVLQWTSKFMTKRKKEEWKSITRKKKSIKGEINTKL